MRFFRITAFVLTALLLLSLPQAAQASSPRVAALQVALKSMHLYKGKVDGVTGPLTRRGVIRLQRKRGIRSDGLTGPRTKRALGWRGKPAIGSRTMRRGQRGWDVAALQFLLQRSGYGAGRADGVFGRLTRQAVLRAQRAAGLAADGLAGPRTIAFLRSGTRARGGGDASDPGRVLVDHDPTSGPIAFERPVVGSIGDRFGAPRNGYGHTGIDFPVAQGTPISASAAGTVIFAGYNSGGYGNLVVVQHEFGYTTWYAHMSKVLASVGRQVATGARLGLVGSTGRSTGPHLHFEIRHYDTPIDPEPLLTPEATMARVQAVTAGAASAGGQGHGGQTARAGKAARHDHSEHGGHHGHAEHAGHADHMSAACAPGAAPTRAGTNWIATEPLCHL